VQEGGDALGHVQLLQDALLFDPELEHVASTKIFVTVLLEPNSKVSLPPNFDSKHVGTG
jgi:hypothetical protein